MKQNLLDRRAFLGTAGIIASGTILVSGNPVGLMGKVPGKKVPGPCRSYRPGAHGEEIVIQQE